MILEIQTPAQDAQHLNDYIEHVKELAQFATCREMPEIESLCAQLIGAVSLETIVLEQSQ